MRERERERDRDRDRQTDRQTDRDRDRDRQTDREQLLCVRTKQTKPFPAPMLDLPVQLSLTAQ